VLDLPGFENLPYNGFDQLLVNIAAEQLQECFNKYARGVSFSFA
jgi:myosin heavy subunit